MKDTNIIKYNVINIFISKDEEDMKTKINKIIKNLCTNELEFISDLRYNKDATLLGDAIPLKKEASNNVN